MVTIEERFNDFSRIASFTPNDKGYHFAKACWLQSATEQKAIDDDHLREATKMLIKKACDAHCRICDYYLCCPYEFEIEGCYERNEILKVMEE